jgi:hypothetical protein
MSNIRSNTAVMVSLKIVPDNTTKHGLFLSLLYIDISMVSKMLPTIHFLDNELLRSL